MNVRIEQRDLTERTRTKEPEETLIKAISKQKIGITIIIILVCILYYQKIIGFDSSTKILIGIFLFFISLIILSAAAYSGEKKQTEKNKEITAETPEKTPTLKQQLGVEKFGIFAQVQENHVWILRNAWGSNPNSPMFDGYTKKTEGWNLFFPFIYHDEVCIIDLYPLQRDIFKIELNTMDNMSPKVNYRIKSWVLDYDIGKKGEKGYFEAIPYAACKYATRVKDRERLEDQWAHVALNRIASKYPYSGTVDVQPEDDAGNPIVDSTTGEPKTEKRKGLTEFGAEDLKKFGDDASKIFNEEMRHFGINAEISILNIPPIKSIEAASAAKRVAEIDEKAAEHQSAAYSKIRESGVNPTIAYIGSTALKIFGSLYGAGEEDQSAPTTPKEKERK